MASREVIDVPEFSLEKTLFSGQVFHWTALEEGFLGAIGNLPVYLKQEGPTLHVKGASAGTVRYYLSLDHPLFEITQSFRKDPAMEKALEFSKGLRIIRQPIWECLGTFLTSAMKQVQHIRAISLSLRRRFGQRLVAGDKELYAYPDPETLAHVSLSELLDCRLGFRAKNLLQAAKAVAGGEIDLNHLQSLSTEKVRGELCKLPGVGEKIANCVLLFAYQRLDAVPIDVWITRVLKEAYFADRTKVSMNELRAFSNEYFGSYAGYAQQYLFHHWRMTYRRKQ